MDRIKLEGLEFYGYHGCLPSEREQGQHFYIDISMYLDLAAAGRTDDLKATVNYAEVYLLIKDIVQGEPVNLIEALGERIAGAVLEKYATISRVRVTVHKPEAPIPGLFTDASVSIVRSRA